MALKTQKTRRRKPEEENQIKIEIIFYSLHINKHNEYNY